MHEIKNLTNSPYDLETANGSVRLPAMGSVKGKFSDEQLTALRGCGLYEVTAAKAEQVARKSKG